MTKTYLNYILFLEKKIDFQSNPEKGLHNQPDNSPAYITIIIILSLIVTRKTDSVWNPQDLPTSLLLFIWVTSTVFHNTGTYEHYKYDEFNLRCNKLTVPLLIRDIMLYQVNHTCRCDVTVCRHVLSVLQANTVAFLLKSDDEWLQINFHS